MLGFASILKVYHHTGIGICSLNSDSVSIFKKNNFFIYDTRRQWYYGLTTLVVNQERVSIVGVEMAKPKGSVTVAQYEILKILWAHSEPMSVVEIWQEVQEQKKVSRTTVLNQVDRLEKRNWLSREKIDGVFRYSANSQREETEQMLADEFLGDFFGGSPGDFILSLLGNRKISKSEVARLKKLLDGDPSKDKTVKTPAKKRGSKDKKKGGK